MMASIHVPQELILPITRTPSRLRHSQSNNLDPKPLRCRRTNRKKDNVPVGVPEVSGKGRGRRNHYKAFEYDGNTYELEDPVLLSPEDENQKPYVAIIKDIIQKRNGSMVVTGQWFYRPEEAERKGGGRWQSRDTRELFYSFHRDDLPAESVMHKCVVHFIPKNKQLPLRKQHPGFIVQKVYDTVEKKLWKLTDKDYEDNKQHEIDLLVQKTIARLGDLADIEPEETSAMEQEDQSKSKRTLRRKNISPLDVTREEEATTTKSETPGSCTSNSEYYAILLKFKALTGDNPRDKWLERLLQGIQYMCNSPDSMHGDDNGKGGCDGPDHERDNQCVTTSNGSQEKSLKGGKSFIWPDAAVPAVIALENASQEAFNADFQKYNQKLRQLVFNLKNNALLARRLLNGELEPSKILNMSPNELKEGLTAEETAKKEPDDSERMQMTDARCSRCNESKVGLRDIIQAGHGDRYQLECIACGFSWYASRDEASTLTVDGANSVKSVGIEPLATTKFESVEKLLSPRGETEKSANEVLKKSSEAYMPVLEAQRSFGKTKNEDNSESAKKAETLDLAMGLEMELDFDKRSSVGLSPNTVLPSPRQCSNVEKRSINRKSTCRDDVFRVKEGFTEISFRRYRSSSCKNIPSRPVMGVSDVELKRGSIYQSSQEVRKMKKMGAIEGREKRELSRSSDSSFSFRVVDSLCSSDEESSKRTSLMSEKSNSIATSLCESSVKLSPSDGGFIDFRLNSDNREIQSAETARRNAVEDPKFRCDEVVVPLNDGNDLLERDAVLTFQKSHSVKVEMPSSPSLSESDCSSKASSKSRFSPIRRMFDPFKKSKSLRSPLGYTLQLNEVRTTGMESAREGTVRKSLLDDFSHTAHKSEFDYQHLSPVANSPVHLHGFLKLENKQGVPSFEFSLNCPEDVIMAKTWKADSAFNWAYTFHSLDGRKKSNASSWGSNDSNKGTMVGQMQVSSYICSEVKDGGVFNNSMMTEFVLYDTAHARQSVIAQNPAKCYPDVKHRKCSNPGLVEGNGESNDRSNSLKLKDHPKSASCNNELDSSNKSTMYPWASEDLRPNLEVAAIVIEMPFEKRESLKYKRGHKISDKNHSNLLNLSMVEQQKDHLDSRISEKVKVVIPTGNHGLPSADSWGPSSLLDRWRLGGGCDCGGWDMACPLTVFGNPSICHTSDQPLLDSQQPLELFLQGAKEKTPALTMIVLDEGRYAVDFHAQLSTLQAFSICVAILHGTEAAVAAGQDRSMQLPHSNSLKVLVEEEVKFLIEAVTEEEKNKVTKRREEITPTYMINHPPFSPIARV
ncbi:hypothetical protein EZV62_023041 [Acer yangbiense]|uniref:BAH domain-containing protein n=1 Tax=Acer yangbiense TaxID=1000413 RepID=A0A5C7H118_9ROSI|nr:hypothetical protein EZV62_023041 [Acer yangbiense]